jgi:exopolysaccharide biosynthesis protein
MRCVSCLLTVLFVCGCLSPAQDTQGGRHWVPVFRGVEYAHFVLDSPRKAIVNAVRVDLQAEGISFIVSPENRTKGFPASESRLQTTYDFATAYHVQVAVNANPFRDLNGGGYEAGDPADLRGYSGSNGVMSSSDGEGLPALAIAADNRAAIVEGGIPQGARYVVGGFSQVVRNGTKTPCSEPRCEAAHPRTAAALADGGRTLILVTVDGRQQGISEGLTISELADLLAGLGARDAVELDGGGSTTMVLSDSAPRVVNTPVGLGDRPGTLRPNGNSLGVYARTL